MIEIRTQAEFDAFKSGILSSPATYQKQLILIYPLDGGYQITSSLQITCSDIKIVGVDKPVIKLTSTGTGATTDSVIAISGLSGSELENIRIEGLKLVGNGKTSSYGYAGIYATYVGNGNTAGLTTGTYSRYDSSTVGNSIANNVGLLVSDCVIEQNLGSGVEFDYCDNCKINDIVVQDNGGRGVYINNSLSNTISNVVSQNNNIGIYLNSSSNNTITANTVQNNGSYGILLNTSSSNNTITANTVQNNGDGIYLNSSNNNNTITSNTVQNNSGYGIYVSASSNNTITANIVQNNGNGINLSSSDYNIIGSNEIISNLSYGIYLGSTANDYNNICSNVAYNNTTANLTVGGGTGNIDNVNVTT